MKKGFASWSSTMMNNHNYDSGVYLLRVVSPPGFLLGPQGQSLRSFPFGGPGPLFVVVPKGGPKPLVVRVVTSGSRSVVVGGRERRGRLSAPSHTAIPPQGGGAPNPSSCTGEQPRWSNPAIDPSSSEVVIRESPALDKDVGCNLGGVDEGVKHPIPLLPLGHGEGLVLGHSHHVLEVFHP